MKIANGIEALEVAVNLMGQPSIIYPTVMWDEHTAILVDAGFPHTEKFIIEALEKLGLSIDKLDYIIIEDRCYARGD